MPNETMLEWQMADEHGQPYVVRVLICGPCLSAEALHVATEGMEREYAAGAFRITVGRPAPVVNGQAR